MTGSIETSVPSSLKPWRVATIGVVGALAIGVGVVAGSFLLSARTALGAAASYVPANAPFYLELRVLPSAAQDTALRAFLGHFPVIEGIDLDRPLSDQLGEAMDDLLATQDADVSWSNDVATWFDGHVAVAVTDFGTMGFDAVLLPAAVPDPPSVVVLFGVTDQAAASAAIERITSSAHATFSDVAHGGATIRSSSDGAYAVTSDQVIVGSTADAVAAAIDARAAPSASLAASSAFNRYSAQLPTDWLAFVTYDMTGALESSLKASGGASVANDSLRSLLEHQSMRGALAVTAAGDRIGLGAATDRPTGPYAVDNAERSLASEVPADVLYYSEGGGMGAGWAAAISALKESLAEVPELRDQVGTVESALGADLEELVSWIDSGAVVVGAAPGDSSTPGLYGGVVLVPNDMNAAQRRIGQLITFISLAAADPSSGIGVSRADVAGTEVTTVRWQDRTEGMGGAAFLAPTSVVVQVAVTDDRVLIGIGDTFVPKALTLTEADSLATQDRYADAIADLGGPAATGVTWVDLAGIRQTWLELVPDEADGWLAPLDRFVVVGRVEGDLAVGNAALLVR